MLLVSIRVAQSIAYADVFWCVYLRCVHACTCHTVIVELDSDGIFTDGPPENLTVDRGMLEARHMC